MENKLKQSLLELNLKRNVFGEMYTLGALMDIRSKDIISKEQSSEFQGGRSLDSRSFASRSLDSQSLAPLCYCLEPSKRTRYLIPAGKYKVIINHSNKFGRDLPLLLNVPGFEGIRIHRGNTSKDTKGCILPGDLYTTGYVTNSTKWEQKIIDLIMAYKECFIVIS